METRRAKRRRVNDEADEANMRRARSIFEAMVAWHVEEARPFADEAPRRGRPVVFDSPDPSVTVGALDTLSRSTKALRDRHRELVPGLEVAVTQASTFEQTPHYYMPEAFRWQRRDTNRIDTVHRYYNHDTGSFVERVDSYENGATGALGKSNHVGKRSLSGPLYTADTPAGRRAQERQKKILGV